MASIGEKSFLDVAPVIAKEIDQVSGVVVSHPGTTQSFADHDVSEQRRQELCDLKIE